MAHSSGLNGRPTAMASEQTTTLVVPCGICDKAVSLTTAKIDERGGPVHVECYVAQLKFVEKSAP